MRDFFFSMNFTKKLKSNKSTSFDLWKRLVSSKYNSDCVQGYSYGNNITIIYKADLVIKLLHVLHFVLIIDNLEEEGLACFAVFFGFVYQLF